MHILCEMQHIFGGMLECKLQCKEASYIIFHLYKEAADRLLISSTQDPFSESTNVVRIF